MGIKPHSQRENLIPLIGTKIYQFSVTDGTSPNVFQLRNFSTTDTVYFSTKANIDTQNFDLSVVAGGTRVFTTPKGATTVYLYCITSCNVVMNTWEGDGFLPTDLDQNQISVISNSQVTSSVAVTSMPPLGAGVNHLGSVGLDTSIPTGANTIGNVNINGIIPISNATIGEIDDLQNTDATSSWSLVSLLKGIWTKLGALTISGMLPTGTNKIGKVDIDLTTNPIPTYATSPTIQNVTCVSANTEYSLTLPANTKRFIVSVQDYDSSAILSIYFSSGSSTVFKMLGYMSYGEEKVLCGNTLYFKSSIAGKVVQILSWV